MSTVWSRRQFLGAAAAAPAFAARSEDPQQYPIYHAKGTHKELGRQHGEQARMQIARHLDAMCSSQKLTRKALSAKAARFQPLFQQHCPHLLEEMQGLAEGARVSLQESMACSIRGELSHIQQEGCTAYVIGRGHTAAHNVIAGQNSDMDDSVPPMAYILHLQPIGKPEVLTWTFGGMIGYHGMNSAGVAHFANALGGGPAGRFGMPHYPVKRMMLECTTADQAADLLRRIPLASNGNYVLCDGKGNLLDVEATTSGPEILRDTGAGFLAHTNHYVCSRYAKRENFDRSWKDSFPRLDRINQLVASRKGKLTVDDMKTFLKDHQGEPTGICRHDGPSRTVASLIAEPSQRRMHVAVGNPCRSQYVTYSI